MSKRNYRLATLNTESIKVYKNRKEYEKANYLFYPGNVAIFLIEEAEIILLDEVDQSTSLDNDDTLPEIPSSTILDLDSISSSNSDVYTNFNPKIEYTEGDVVFYNGYFYTKNDQISKEIPGQKGSVSWDLKEVRLKVETILTKAYNTLGPHWDSDISVFPEIPNKNIILEIVNPPTRISDGSVIKILGSNGLPLNDPNYFKIDNNEGFKKFDIISADQSYNNSMEISYTVLPEYVDATLAKVTLGLDSEIGDGVHRVELIGKTGKKMVREVKKQGSRIISNISIEKDKIYYIDKYTPIPAGRSLFKYYNHDFSIHNFDYINENTHTFFKAKADGVVSENFLEVAQDIFGPMAPPNVEQITRSTILKPGRYYDLGPDSFIGSSDYKNVEKKSLEIESGTGAPTSPYVYSKVDLSNVVYRYIDSEEVSMANKDPRMLCDSFEIVSTHDSDFNMPLFINEMDYGINIEKDLIYKFNVEKLIGIGRTNNIVDFGNYTSKNYHNTLFIANESFYFGGSPDGPINGDKTDIEDNIGRYDILDAFNRLQGKFRPYNDSMPDWPKSVSQYRPGTWKKGDLVYIRDGRTPYPHKPTSVTRWSDVVDISETFEIDSDHTYSSAYDIWDIGFHLNNVDPDRPFKKFIKVRWASENDDFDVDLSFEDKLVSLRKESNPGEFDYEDHFTLIDSMKIQIAMIGPGGAGGPHNGSGGGGGGYVSALLFMPPGQYVVKQGHAAADISENGTETYLYDVDNGSYIIRCYPGANGDYGYNGFKKIGNGYVAHDAYGGLGGIVEGDIFNPSSPFFRNGGKVLNLQSSGAGGPGGNSVGLTPFKHVMNAKWNRQRGDVVVVKPDDEDRSYIWWGQKNPENRSPSRDDHNLLKWQFITADETHKILAEDDIKPRWHDGKWRTNKNYLESYICPNVYIRDGKYYVDHGHELHYARVYDHFYNVPDPAQMSASERQDHKYFLVKSDGQEDGVLVLYARPRVSTYEIWRIKTGSQQWTYIHTKNENPDPDNPDLTYYGKGYVNLMDDSEGWSIENYVNLCTILQDKAIPSNLAKFRALPTLESGYFHEHDENIIVIPPVDVESNSQLGAKATTSHRKDKNGKFIVDLGTNCPGSGGSNLAQIIQKNDSDQYEWVPLKSVDSVVKIDDDWGEQYISQTTLDTHYLHTRNSDEGKAIAYPAYPPHIDQDSGNNKFLPWNYQNVSSGYHNTFATAAPEHHYDGSYQFRFEKKYTPLSFDEWLKREGKWETHGSGAEIFRCHFPTNKDLLEYNPSKDYLPMDPDAPSKHQDFFNAGYDPRSLTDDKVIEFINPSKRITPLKNWMAPSEGVGGGGGGALSVYSHAHATVDHQPLTGKGSNGGGRSGHVIDKMTISRFDMFDKKQRNEAKVAAEDFYCHYGHGHPCVWGFQDYKKIAQFSQVLGGYSDKRLVDTHYHTLKAALVANPLAWGILLPVFVASDPALRDNWYRPERYWNRTMISEKSEHFHVNAHMVKTYGIMHPPNCDGQDGQLGGGGGGGSRFAEGGKGSPGFVHLVISDNLPEE